MAISVSGVITQVGTLTGFTSATWTFGASTTTIPYGKMGTVTAKGGTQPSAVDIHSGSRPNSVMVTRPATIRQLPALNAQGALPSVPLNVYKTGLNKGVTVLAGQPAAYLGIDTNWRVPAGADIADPDNIAAGVAEYIAWLVANEQAIVDMLKTGEP
jgi:hypothetical protein